MTVNNKYISMTFEAFPAKTYDKVRFADTDQLGHVNNAVFSTFFETGRAEFALLEDKIIDDHCTIVIANIEINFLEEISWPGTVEIGTLVKKIGNSSVALYQRLFQNGKCVADANSVMVQMNLKTRKSSPLTEDAKKILSKYL